MEAVFNVWNENSLMGKSLATSDPEINEAINLDMGRQHDKLVLIASENYVSKAVLEAQGSVLTNKYAEGYPGKRYYGGCEYVDVVETLAIERAKKLFGADHANVQSHSGSQANMAAYSAVMQPGDTYMGLDLSHGGHLTHGSPVNASGKLYNIVHYGVDRETEVLDYDNIRKIAQECKPKLIVSGASCYPRFIDFEALRSIADEVGAYLMIDIAHIAGMVATGAHPSPIPYAHIVTTTTHKTLRGPRGGMILCKEELATAIDKAVFPGMQGGPLMHTIAAKAVCFKEAMTPEFAEYQTQTVKNSKVMAERLAKNGLRLVSGGTDNHLMLVDLTDKGMTGKKAQEVLDNDNIVISRSTIPFDTQKPYITSGIRIGTPAVTTRGMKEAEMEQIADFITMSLLQPEKSAEVKAGIKTLCDRFPIY